MKKDFAKIIVNKKIQEKFISHPKLQELYKNFALDNEKFLAQLKKATDSKEPKQIENVAKSIFNAHLKQDQVSKWVRNLSVDILKLRASLKAKTNASSLNGSVEKSTPKKDPIQVIKKFYNDYKTLNNSVLLGGFIPIFGVAFGIPFAIASWLTNIQLKAGKIGVMKAMEEIDNPKLFVNDNDTRNR